MRGRIQIAWIMMLSLAGCAREVKPTGVQAANAPAPLEVRAVASETRRVERSIAVTGSLHPDESVNASFEIPGRITAIRVDFGQSVRRGDIIAELDKQEFQLQLERSRAALDQALARIGLDPGQESATPTQTPAIRQAQAQMEDARSKFESAAKLVTSGDISSERHVELEKAYRARQAALDAARDELRTQIANVQALRADVKLAQKRLGDATLRAPFDGAVSAKMLSPGQFVKENTPIVTLVKTYPLRLLVEIPESAAGAARIGTALSFVTDAAPGMVFQAAVRELNPTLDARSRSLTVEARLSQNDPRLRPGMFVQVRLVTARDTVVTVIPKPALYTVAGLTKAFVLRDGRAVEVQFAPGQDIDGWVESPAGKIRAGELLAVSGLGALIDGAPVQVKK